jgi:hypothetical protein
MIDNVLYQSQGEDVNRLSAVPDTSGSYRIEARQNGVAQIRQELAHASR